MQDIVFYAVANETLGAVRDYTNVFHPDAPVLTIGVAVCLRMRLFASDKGVAPYPIASFDGITNWQWSMDSDFDRSTACKLVADANGISVHTVTDMFDGETASFTEFVIPISNMNTEELSAWLGNDGTKSGLNGELVGYDNEGHSMFVLQIENFKVRNRVAGLGDPTAVDEGIVTRPMAEQMILSAVSASAATKQDKLGPGNAGTGISITSAGIISTANIPQSAVTGLSSSLSTKQDKLGPENAGAGISITSAGAISTANVPQSAVTGLEAALNNKQNSLSTGLWIEIDDDRISVERYHTIHGPYSRGSVTLQAGEAYKIYATTSAVTLDAGNIPNDTWGLEGHAEIFVANTGYIQTTSRVVLANALEPDAVNNCTVRFHDGLAIISVEDHVAGYIVVYASGSTSGTLPYGIDTAEQEYIAFDATLDGTTIDLSGSTANGEKHLVGNGYSNTILTGDVNCGTSEFTVANLSLQNVSINGGIMTFGDACIPSGSTVAVSGGGLAVEKVSGAGAESVIDLGGVQYLTINDAADLRSCSVVSGSDYAILVSSATLKLDSVEFRSNVTNDIIFTSRGNVSVTRCTLDGSVNTAPLGIYNIGSMSITSSFVSGFSERDILTAGTLDLEGNTIGKLTVRGGTVTFAGRNKIDLATSQNSSRYGSVEIASGAIVDLTGVSNPTPIAPGGGITFEAGGATVYPSAGSAGAYVLGGVTLTSLGNTNVISGGTATISGNAVIVDCALAGGTVTIPTGATVSLSGTTVDVPLSGTIIVADGDGDASIALINSAGISVHINGATYTSIAKDGTATE